MEHLTPQESRNKVIRDALIDRLHYLCEENMWEDAIAFYEEHNETLAAGEKV
jgi:hypothetical protein|tara:strand:- start:1750 stop:1905 length:156 start_codon:yes stop_codon:yes gene_type:complete